MANQNSIYTGEKIPIYTVEQVELIRRLRMTGIRARQIIEAFNELDRIELDLGSSIACENIENDHENMSFVATNDQSSNEVAEMIEELMGREDSAIEELRNYVNQNQVKQHVIASTCRISQPYVSKVLNGNYREVSDRLKRFIFAWYVQHMKNAVPLENSSFNFLRNDGIANIDSMQRRERFVFKPAHNKVLLALFSENPYPGLDQRLKLAMELNSTYASQCGKLVSDLDAKEIVTEHLLATWFTNKRRETKTKGLTLKLIGKRGRPRKLSQNCEPSTFSFEDSASNEISVVENKFFKTESLEDVMESFGETAESDA